MTLHLQDRILKPRWMDFAACKDTDVDFFPDARNAKKQQAAIAMCGECAVQDLCAEYAVQEEIEFGIWGGLTELDRKAIRDG